MRPETAASLNGFATSIVTPQVGPVSGRLDLTGTARLSRRSYAYLGLSGEYRTDKSKDLGASIGMRASF